MLPRRSPVRDRKARRGTAAVEALFVLPLLLLVVLGMVGVADLILSEQMLSEAGGRAANATISVRPVGGQDKDPVPPGGLLEVRIELAARHATATRFALVDPDEVLVGRAVMQRE